MPRRRHAATECIAESRLVAASSRQFLSVELDRLWRGGALRPQLRERPLRLFELEAHRAQYLRRLRELHVAVADHLHVVPPRVAERAVRRARHRDARGRAARARRTVRTTRAPRRSSPPRAPRG